MYRRGYHGTRHNTAHNCSESGSGTDTLSETFGVFEMHRLLQGDAGCHHQTARTVGKASDTSHLTPIPLSMSKNY
jgi:hypothetical protein